MSETTMEQKLQLVKQVRSRYHENQYDLSNRERILYGRTSAAQPRAGYPSPYDEGYGDPALPEGAPLTFFKLRLWLALLLVTTVILLDLNDTEVAGITAQKIFEVISADYEEVIETWMENLQ